MADDSPLVKHIEKLLPKKPVEALECCRELRGIALEKRRYELLAREEGFRGRGYIAVSRVDEGKQTIYQTISWYKRRKLFDSSSSLINSVGADYLQLHEYRDARQWLAAAVQSSARTRAPGVLYKSLYNLGIVEQRDGNLTKARKYLEKSLEVAGGVGDVNLVPLLGTLGEVYIKLGDTLSAGQVLSQGQRLAAQQQDWEHALSMGLDAAAVMTNQGRLDEARFMYQEAAAAARAKNLPAFEMKAVCGLGKVMLAQGDTALVLQVLQGGIQMLKRFPSLLGPDTVELYKYLAITYQKLFGDQDKSYRCYLEYRRALDSLRIVK